MSSTERLTADLHRVWAGGRLAILTGNVGDYHVGSGGAIVELPQLIACAAASTRRATVRWTPASGTAQITPPGRSTIRFAGPGPSTDLPSTLHRLLDELGSARDAMVLVIDWVSLLIGRPDEPVGIVAEQLVTAAADMGRQAEGHRLVIIDRDGTASRTLGRFPPISTVTVRLPDFDERRAFMDRLATSTRAAHVARISETESRDRVASAANGMSLRSLFAVMCELGGAEHQLDSAALLPAKRDFVVQHTDGALRLLEDSIVLDQMAGLHNVRLLVEQHSRPSAPPLRNLVLAGPPGTGKSTVAAALGPALGRTPVALGRIHDSLVGGSEQRMRTSIDTSEAMAPSLVFVDEIDQALSGDDGPSGDSGVTKRTNAMFWEWTGSMDSGVLKCAATNRPEVLGERVLDRFTVVPVLHPDPHEAAQIVQLAAARLGREIEQASVADLVCSRPHPLSGRTLVEIVRAAVTCGAQRDANRTSTLGRDDLRAAADDVLVPACAEGEELMGLQAIRFTRRRSLLPWVAARARNAPYEVPSYLAPFVDGAGDVDQAALLRRIDDLSRSSR